MANSSVQTDDKYSCGLLSFLFIAWQHQPFGYSIRNITPSALFVITLQKNQTENCSFLRKTELKLIRRLVSPNRNTIIIRRHNRQLYTPNINPQNGTGVNWLHLAIQVLPTFLISDIQALWRSGLSDRVPECQKLKLVG